MAVEKVYEVAVPDSMTLEQGLAEARVRARGVGILIEGGVEGGTFTGPAQGRYVVLGRRLRLEIEKKPKLVPWGLVESGLRQVFGNVTATA